MIVVKIPVVRRHARLRPVPILKSARMKGRPESWPGEQLERLLTPRELDEIWRGHL
ncbi:hypothetical protein [Rhodococcus kronopolitis]|uniref:Uncharacterized protein n=1 Tax=Rhodococcus kronopolitis TaxID=1460226 RepID=A0ABV9FS38_9NOCA